MQKMLRSATAAILLMCAACTSFAADSPELRLAAANRYLAVVPMSRLLDQSFSELAKQVPLEKRPQFLSHMKASVRADVLERVSRDAMVKVFTADELNALADFYGSEHGASAMKKFGVYMGIIMPEVQREILQVMYTVQAPAK
jgi:hypothetical protein